tara:strand:- start:263 stop:442 length:180 start_codon:yes stop_codon:yes gene_type:complete
MWHPLGGVLLGEDIMTTLIKDESGATAIEYSLIFGFLTGIFYFGAATISAYVEETFKIL